MDQIKVVLKWIKDQHFWLLTVLAVVLGLVGWQQGQSHLASETEANKRAIESEFSSARNIGGKSFLANENVNQAQLEQNRVLAAKVLDLWSQLYQRQTEEVLKWPTQLRPSFRKDVAKLRFGDAIISDYRENYFNYIKKRFKDLPEIIGAEVVEDDSSSYGRGQWGRGADQFADEMDMSPAGRSLTGEMASDDFLVIWHDQEVVREQLTWSERPSSLAIWVTQENLWVYETLLKAIAATNEAAQSDRYRNAAVRDIWALQVGQNVPRKTSANRIYTPTSSTEAGFGMSVEGNDMMDYMNSSDYGGSEGDGLYSDFEMYGGAAGGDGSEKSLLLTSRYVDETGQPMPAPLDEGFSFGTEYKRLPVRLELKMDQRYLSRLITELANAPLQIEVEEVRIDPSGDAGGGRGGSRGRRSRNSGNSGEVQAFGQEPHVRERVIIQGLVYIFYPPDQDILTVSPDETDLAEL